MENAARNYTGTGKTQPHSWGSVNWNGAERRGSNPTCIATLYGFITWQRTRRTGDFSRFNKITAICLVILCIYAVVVLLFTKTALIIAAENRELEKVVAKVEVMEKLPESLKIDALATFTIAQLGMVKTTGN